jgi:mRNA interferase HigB
MLSSTGHASAPKAGIEFDNLSGEKHDGPLKWMNSAEVKRLCSTASIVSSDRLVFSIKGNDYRLVVAIEAAAIGQPDYGFTRTAGR